MFLFEAAEVHMLSPKLLSLVLGIQAARCATGNQTALANFQCLQNKKRMLAKRLINPRKSEGTLQKFQLCRNNDFTSIYVSCTSYSFYCSKEIIWLQSIAILKSIVFPLSIYNRKNFKLSCFRSSPNFSTEKSNRSSY